MIAKFQLFVDDSGKNDPPVFVLAGVLSTSTAWAAFREEWKAVLAEPPAVSSLHMAEANRRKGAFVGLTREQRDAKLCALADVVRRHALTYIALTVAHADYEKVLTRQVMRSMDRPYQMLFHLMIAETVKYLDRHKIDGRVEFVFDRQLEHERSLRESFGPLKKGLIAEVLNRLAADPRHADDGEEVALQAADLVAWHIRRSWRDGRDALAGASAAGPFLIDMEGEHIHFPESALHGLVAVARRTVVDMNTLFPHERDAINESYDAMATVANLELIATALPGAQVDLISFPASGTARFRLVNSCAQCRNPHLHRRSGNECLAAVSEAASPDR